jgi:drug/metabolite transporter (DMT)-like permease
MSNVGTPQDRRRFLGMQTRITWFPITVCGVLSILSGALGHDVWNQFFFHGGLGHNDLVPGVVLLVIGLVLLRVSGAAPLTDQVRSIRHWGADRWINFALVSILWLLGMAMVVFGRLLPWWLHYGLLLTVAGALVWLRMPIRSARS